MNTYSTHLPLVCCISSTMAIVFSRRVQFPMVLVALSVAITAMAAGSAGNAGEYSRHEEHTPCLRNVMGCLRAYWVLSKPGGMRGGRGGSLGLIPPDFEFNQREAKRGFDGFFQRKGKGSSHQIRLLSSIKSRLPLRSVEGDYPEECCTHQNASTFRPPVPVENLDDFPTKIWLAVYVQGFLFSDLCFLNIGLCAWVRLCHA